MRDTSKGQTVQLDTPEAQCLAKEECGGGAANPTFQLAAADGSRVIFTDLQPLSKDASKTPGKADLYECEITEDVAGKLGCQLSDLTPAAGPGQAADVQGIVIGASTDASWVYFVANGVLGDAAAHGASTGSCKGSSGQGTCNLYVSHEGQTRLITVLSGTDYPDWASGGGAVTKLTARVSPNGQWLAFMSQRSLTGYDNHDTNSGEPDEEVFVYGAQEASIACASCERSGARPTGVEYETLNDHLVGGDRVWENEAWIAANVPGWTPYLGGHALYQSRYLSDSGRLFFNAAGALVAQDINNNQDVYQYEPAGVGDCTDASASFNEASRGCVALISSGRAAGESAFLDAGESGDDVFFMTSERLVPTKDIDTAYDLYDAHVCSAGAECFSETEPPPPCANAESCRAAPTPQPSIFGSPSSATFSGQGNIPPPPPPGPKSHLTRAQQLAKALRACQKKYKKSKRRRASCQRQAHKRYGGKATKKAKSKAKKTAKKGARR
jgi:hypothetical protein